MTLHFHNSYITTYNAKIHYEQKPQTEQSLDTSSQPTPPKLLKCYSSFNILEHYLICDDLCLEKSTKNPGHHKKVVRCRTIRMNDNLITISPNMFYKFCFITKYFSCCEIYTVDSKTPMNLVNI